MALRNVVDFRVDREIFEAFPGLRIAVAVADGVDNRTARPGVDDAWREAWRRAGALELANPQSHPHVAAWRRALKTGAGVSHKKHPSSIEAMLRRAMKGGEPFRVSPLVDFYNAVSLRRVVPAGGYDLDEIGHGGGGTLRLRRTRDGDTFEALGAAGPRAVAAGEVAYTDGGSEVLTRHLVWRQSERGAITPASRRVLLLSEILGEQDDALLETVLGDLRDGLAHHFGVAPRTAVVDVDRPRVP